MELRISRREIEKYNCTLEYNFPKYSTQLLNIANQNSQATRPRNVGQLSDLFQEYIETSKEISIEGWREWYTERYPDAIDNAAEKTYSQLLHFKDVLNNDIDRELVREWITDLIINKTYNGLYFQEVILKVISEHMGEPYRLASPEEEAEGIDGYVGEQAYSIKPHTYKNMMQLPETIDVIMVYYTKTKSALNIEIEE